MLKFIGHSVFQLILQVLVDGTVIRRYPRKPAITTRSSDTDGLGGVEESDGGSAAQVH
jgi:hypothetical protein